MSDAGWKVDLGVFAGLAALFMLVYLAGSTLTPFVAAAFFAYVLNPAVNRLEARGVKRGLAVGLFLAAFFLAGAAAVGLAVYVMQRELSALIANLPAYAETFEARYLPTLRGWFGLGEEVDLAALTDQAKAGLMELSPESISSAGAYVLKLLSGTVGVLLAALNLILIPVLMAYMMIDFERMKDKVGALLPGAHRARIVGKLVEVEEVLKLFARGQLTVALVMGVLYSIGLFIVGVDMAFLVGMGAGVLNLVPYLGGAVGIVAAVSLAALKFHDVWHPLGVVAVFVVVQSIEGYLLTPKIVGDRLGLHPLAVMLALVVFAQLMGFVGVLLAVPIAAVLKVFVSGFLKDYKASGLYGGK